MAEEKIAIELSNAEALVLFEFVSEFSTTGQLAIVDQAEARVLWDICARLESILVEPFAENYRDLLAIAREQVRHKE